MDHPLNPAIKKGFILVYRVFDIGEEIDLVAVEKIVRENIGSRRLSINRSGRNAVVIRNAPVQLGLGEVELNLGRFSFRAELNAKVFDYGCLSLVFQIPIAADTPWDTLIPLGAILNGDSPGDERLNELACQKAGELSLLLAPAIKTPSQWHVFEDYTIYFIEQIEGSPPPKSLLTNGKIPELILGELQEKLASKSRDAVLEEVYQYSESDLVVIDWNGAVVIEPSGARDIPDVLEFALTHLLEFRYYDELIDGRLADLYDAIEAKKNKWFRGNYGKLSREANTRFMEFSEFIERIDNSLKVVGDFYLAVIYRAAIRRMRIHDWQSSISKKMGTLANVSHLLQSDVNTYKSHLMEGIIVVLIFFEIVQAILRSHTN